MLFCCALTLGELEAKNERIEKLISCIAEGKTDAMDRLYTLVKTDVYAFALSKTQNQHDAEDVMQDTFIQIYRYARGYEAKGKPLAWIFTIVSHLCVRKHVIANRNTELDSEYETLADDRDYAMDAVMNEFLREIMQILSPKEQEIIVLHIVSGLKHAQIADLLDRPLSTVLSTYNRAIKKMRKYVEETEE